jgi:hypothetical protein
LPCTLHDGRSLTVRFTANLDAGSERSAPRRTTAAAQAQLSARTSLYIDAVPHLQYALDCSDTTPCGCVLTRRRVMPLKCSDASRAVTATVMAESRISLLFTDTPSFQGAYSALSRCGGCGVGPPDDSTDVGARLQVPHVWSNSYRSLLVHLIDAWNPRVPTCRVLR